jgi:hypothetical protein
MSNEKRLKELRELLARRVGRETIRDVKYMLAIKDECSHPEHSIQPKRYDDWASIDRMLCVVTHTLECVMAEYVAAVITFSMRMEGCEDADDVREMMKDKEFVGYKVIGLECSVKACQAILTAHHSIVAEYGRSNTADMHYGRIVADVSERYAKMAGGIDAVESDALIPESVQTEVDDLMKKFRGDKKPPTDKGKMH